MHCFACAKNCGFGLWGFGLLFWEGDFVLCFGRLVCGVFWWVSVESGLNGGIRHHRGRMNNFEHTSLHGIKVR